MAYVRISFIVLALFVPLLIDCRFINYGICRPDEAYSLCSTQCEQTCADKDTWQQPCNHMCAIGCFCINGYVRQSDKNSPCIKKSEC
ncbi:unnamed protein product [Rotaria sp. Silwood1]|nr:unnamed protein product [Rotaria sp. Silwood1]CAF3339817.1 unnamed protein product [Rotaria sp. Silwood1]CAF3403030.1 unnamed protein product [Rotaria sp. Silwood1]CAF4760653.1 unnamed protein product [Rotaria sp. Silwood1]CAF4879801.1 unnamed protein product [Rotaria sp. Silwood1]